MKQDLSSSQSMEFDRTPHPFYGIANWRVDWIEAQAGRIKSEIAKGVQAFKKSNLGRTVTSILVPIRPYWSDEAIDVAMNDWPGYDYTRETRGELYLVWTGDIRSAVKP